MLTKFRIEVEEDSPDKCVETLTKYEHALQAQEVKRYAAYFPVSIRSDGEPTEDERRLGDLDHTWDVGVQERNFFNGEVGREVIEEVIEFDPNLPGYRGRRVVAFTRIDTRPRSHAFQFEILSASDHWSDTLNSGTGGGPAVAHSDRAQMIEKD